MATLLTRSRRFRPGAFNSPGEDNTTYPEEIIYFYRPVIGVTNSLARRKKHHLSGGK
jgi:hypothetical protein